MMNLTVFLGRSNEFELMTLFDGSPPTEDVTRAVLRFGDLIFDSDQGEEISVDSTGLITARLGESDIQPGVYRPLVTVYTANYPNGLAAGRPEIRVMDWPSAEA